MLDIWKRFSMKDTVYSNHSDRDSDSSSDSDEGDAAATDELTRRLLDARSIVISGNITMRSAQRTINQLLVLEADEPDVPIDIFISSGGGDADAGFAVYDMIKFVKSPVRTVSVGLTGSAATTVFLGARKENRFALPNARLLIHQPATSFYGRASELEINAREILRFREKTDRVIAEETGQSFEKVQQDTVRDHWMTAEEAKEYGIVGAIIASRDELEKEEG